MSERAQGASARKLPKKKKATDRAGLLKRARFSDPIGFSANVPHLGISGFLLTQSSRQGSSGPIKSVVLNLQLNDADRRAQQRHGLLQRQRRKTAGVWRGCKATTVRRAKSHPSQKTHIVGHVLAALPLHGHNLVASGQAAITLGCAARRELGDENAIVASQMRCTDTSSDGKAQAIGILPNRWGKGMQDERRTKMERGSWLNQWLTLSSSTVSRWVSGARRDKLRGSLLLRTLSGPRALRTISS